jgi:hypothetical protein
MYPTVELSQNTRLVDVAVLKQHYAELQQAANHSAATYDALIASGIATHQEREDAWEMYTTAHAKRCEFMDLMDLLDLRYDVTL